MPHRVTLLSAFVVVGVLLLDASSLPQPSTFSIVAYDRATADIGVAVASKFPAVGALVPWARAGVGAVATQALANLDYGPRGLEMLALGFSAPQVREKLVETDALRDDRQFGIVDAQGRAAAWTGPKYFRLCRPQRRR